MFDPRAFGGEGGWAVQAVHGAVEACVGAAEGWGHEAGVVEVRQGCVRVGGAGVEDGLGQRLQLRQARLAGLFKAKRLAPALSGSEVLFMFFEIIPSIGLISEKQCYNRPGGR